MLFKVYVLAMVLADRLEVKVERKRIIPQTQIGFRKEVEIIDNIYVIII